VGRGLVRADRHLIACRYRQLPPPQKKTVAHAHVWSYTLIEHICIILGYLYIVLTKSGTLAFIYDFLEYEGTSIKHRSKPTWTYICEIRGRLRLVYSPSFFPLNLNIEQMKYDTNRNIHWKDFAKIFESIDKNEDDTTHLNILREKWPFTARKSFK